MIETFYQGILRSHIRASAIRIPPDFLVVTWCGPVLVFSCYIISYHKCSSLKPHPFLSSQVRSLAWRGVAGISGYHKVESEVSAGPSSCQEAHPSCWQNSIPRGYQTEVPISLPAVVLGLLPPPFHVARHPSGQQCCASPPLFFKSLTSSRLLKASVLGVGLPG